MQKELQHKIIICGYVFFFFFGAVTSNSCGSLMERYCFHDSHFPDEKTEVWRGHVIVPNYPALKRHENFAISKLGLNPGPITSWVCDLGQVI